MVRTTQEWAIIVLSRITRRAATTDELKALRRRALGPQLRRLVLLLLYAFLLPAAILWLVIVSIAVMCGADDMWAVIFVGSLTALQISLAIFVLAIRDESLRRAAIRNDPSLWEIEEIHVVMPEVIWLPTYGKQPSPTLVVQLDSRHVLFLSGPWLLDPNIYGASQASDEPRAPTFNGLPAPYAFPNTQFTVVRLLTTGDVLVIRVAGVYLDPGPPVNIRAGQYLGRASEILDGRWEEAEEIAARHIYEHGK